MPRKRWYIPLAVEVGAVAYSYDGAGNMLNYTLNGVTSFYYIGPSNELLQEGSTLMAYDADGNMIGKVTGSTSWTCSYDFEDRLANATLNGQLIGSNLYDGSGERLMATVNGSSVVYAYEGTNVLYERNMTTGEVTDHFYLGRLQLAKLSSSSSYYYHFDALGSIRLVTNAGAINAFSTNYLPYGIEYNTTGMETFLYTDKPVDASTGLYYFGARFYDASLFRFVSKDTNLGSTDDPLSLNLYAYSRDNPQRYVDSNGHSTVLSTTLMRTDSFNPLKKMDPLAYFLDWCQRHVLNLLEGLLLITLTILGPLYLMEFGPNVGAFVIMIVMPAAWGWGNLAYDMQKNDIGAAMFDVLSMAFALYDAWKVLVNPVTLWLLNLASAAMDVATEGILLAIRMPLVASAVAAFIAWIGADYAYEYSCYLAE